MNAAGILVRAAMPQRSPLFPYTTILSARRTFFPARFATRPNANALEERGARAWRRLGGGGGDADFTTQIRRQIKVGNEGLWGMVFVTRLHSIT